MSAHDWRDKEPAPTPAPRHNDHVRVTALADGWQDGSLRVGETYVVEFVLPGGELCFYGHSDALCPFLGDTYEIVTKQAAA